MCNIILVVLTAFYATATYQILEIQNKAEKLKWFIQVNIRSWKATWSANTIEAIELEFYNVSPCLGYCSIIKMFEEDSLVEFIENENVLTEKNIGILQPNYSSFQKFVFKNPLIFKHGTIKIRVELSTMNPLKIRNTLCYLITARKFRNNPVSLEIELLDFSNGVKEINSKNVRNLSLYETSG